MMKKSQKMKVEPIIQAFHKKKFVAAPNCLGGNERQGACYIALKPTRVHLNIIGGKYRFAHNFVTFFGILQCSMSTSF